MNFWRIVAAPVWGLGWAVCMIGVAFGFLGMLLIDCGLMLEKKGDATVWHP